ncbi:MAG: phytanoyl-CoA dioxygenase family protein [Rhodospirillales bacterium]
MTGIGTVPSPPAPSAAPPSWLAGYRRDGFAVLRGVFGPADIAELKRAFDRERAAALKRGRSWRHGNLCFRVTDDPKLGRVATMAQWPAYHDKALEKYRADPRVLAVVAPLIGRDLKQIINQCHWKPRGAAAADYNFHQDVRFRRPRAAFRTLETAYLQTGIALDAHRPRNGCVRLLPGSHRLGELAALGEGAVMGKGDGAARLVKAGLDPAAIVDLELDPGDLALWGPFMVHGSGPNEGEDERRIYLNSYVRARDCDRGEWAFRAGQPAPLGVPRLVHYEELYTRPGPHYLDSAPPPD